MLDAFDNRKVQGRFQNIRYCVGTLDVKTLQMEKN